MNNFYDGIYNHKINLESRLEMLNFFSLAHKDRGRVPMLFEDIDKLWSLFVINSNCESVTNIYLDLLRRNCEELDEEIVDYITSILADETKLNYANLNMSGCNFLEKFLNVANINKEKLTWDGRSYRVNHPEIIGLDTVFKILRKVENENARHKLTKFLVSFCCNLKSFSEDFCVPYWKSFMDNVFNFLSLACEQKAEKGVRGILTFICNLLTEIGAPGEIPGHDDVNFQRDGIDYTFNYTDKNESRTIKVGYNEYFCEVRTKVSYWFDIPVNLCKFRRQNKLYDMSEDFKLFRDVFSPNSQIEVLQNTHPILLCKDNPKEIIMKDTNFIKTLHELLHYPNASYIQDVWKLVNILPKNSEIENEIVNLGGDIILSSEINWKKYFDEESIYVLSYSLKILKKILNESPSSDWLDNFAKNKGVDYLVSLIYTGINKFSSSLDFECLNDLLFLVTKMKENKSMDSLNLIKRILVIVKSILIASQEKDKDLNLLELQDKHKRRREKDFKADSENEDLEKDENEAICPEVLELWQEEDSSIRSCLNFVKAFPVDIVIKVLLSEKELVNYIFTWGLIAPKNFKLKTTLELFINSLFLSKDESVDLLKSTIFSLMFSRETFKLACGDHNEGSTAFFRIASNLLQMHFTNEDFEKIKLDFPKLTEDMVLYISQPNPDDSILEGYCSLLRVMVLKRREIAEVIMKKYNIIDLVLEKCLLSKCQQHSTSAELPKCKSDSSKSAAYKLLSALAYNNADFTQQIVDKLNNLHALGFWKSNRVLDWKISLQYDEKTSHVGLKNLGCTCYMNSLLQQFFMIPELRESILAVKPPQQSSNITSLQGLKEIFASLKALDSQHYNAKDFTRNFDGQVLDIREQMDVDEFFNTLIDKVENHLKGGDYQNLFKHFFGFTCSDEFICKGCPHYSERQVYSQSMQLQVSNKKSIVESLKAYVEGELLEGDNAYYCDKCDKKVTALKRQCVKRLPRILIVVMKRFEFDYETMAKIKVNDYCEFPFDLNMEPYTQDFLRQKEGHKINEGAKPEGYYNYSLSGVIIHTGTSESGHYYSLIKDGKKWFEFNDTNVKDYDLSDLPGEAFGGTETVYNRDNKKETVEKQTNAYLLFYKRNWEYEDDPFSEEESEYSNKFFNSTVAHVNASNNKFSNISNTLMDRIDSDNLQYWVMKLIFSKDYHSFIADLVTNYNTTEHIVKSCLTKNDNFNSQDNNCIRKSYNNIINCNVKEEFIVYNNERKVSESLVDDYVMINSKVEDFSMFKFAAGFFFNVLVRAKEKVYLPEICDLLKAFINKDKVYAEWLLEEFNNFEVVEKYLIDCPLIDIRKVTVGLLYAAMIKSYKCAQETFKKNSEVTSLENWNEFKIVKFINNIICYYLKFKDNIEKDSTYLYFILYRFSLLGPHTKTYLIQIGVVHFLLANYLTKGGNNQVQSLLENQPIFSLNYSPADHADLDSKLMNRSERLSAFEELLDKKHNEKLFLVRNENYLLMLFCELYKFMSTSQFNSIGKDQNLIKYAAFESSLVRVLVTEAKSKPSAIALADMLALYCFNNIDNTNKVSNVLLELVNGMDSYELEPVMRIFKRFLVKINDSIKETRIKSTIVKYFNVLTDNLRIWSFTDWNIDFIIKLFFNYFDDLKSHIDIIKDSLLKLIKHLKENPYPPTMIPCKNIVMHKKRNLQLPNKINQIQVNNFINRYTNISNDKINKLKEIYYKTLTKESGYDSDYDLTDFKFSVNDIVKYEGYKATVINVLDEMINIAYDKEEIANTKRPACQWVDTDNKFLHLVELHEDSFMQVEK